MTEVYCGPAPTPGSLIGAWRSDVMALMICAVLVCAYAALVREGRRTALVGAVVLFALLFVSPLCALSAALFSARVVHHVLLIAGVAPLLAFAFPATSLKRSRFGIGWIAGLHAALFWFWHAPPIYAVAIGDPLAYWAMQLSLLATGVWFWRRVFDSAERTGGVLLALLGITVQMGMLGALLTFAATPLYEWHLLTTLSFGLTPLQDQQLAGILMWVPSALPYIAAALYRAWPLLGTSEEGASWSG